MIRHLLVATLLASACGDEGESERLADGLRSEVETLRGLNDEHTGMIERCSTLEEMQAIEQDHRMQMNRAMEELRGTLSRTMAGRPSCCLDGWQMVGRMDLELDQHHSAMMTASGIDGARGEEDRHQHRFGLDFADLDRTCMHMMR